MYSGRPLLTRRALLDVAAIFAFGIALASALAGVWPGFDLINQFAPFWALLAIAGGVASRAARRGDNHHAWRRIGFASAALIFSAPAAFDAARALAPHEAKPRNVAIVRVVSQNVWEDNSDIVRTRNYLADQDADFIALLEVSDRALAMLEPLRAKWPYWVRCNSWPYCRVYILSRYPPLAGSRETPTGPLYLKDDRFYPLLTRIAAADFRLGDAPGAPRVRVVAAHLRRPPSLYAQRRDARLLLSELRRVSRENVIVMGDFNQTPWSHSLQALDVETGLTRRTHAMATWPAVFPLVPIDHIYASRSMITVAVSRGPLNGSDHRAALATLAIRPHASK